MAMMQLPSPLTLEEEMKKNPELKMSDVNALRDWCDKQPHLPKIPDVLYVLFLHSNYFRMEPTKNTVENFFTMKTHIPEFFSNRDPIGSKDIRKSFQVVANITLPGETKEGYKLFFGKFIDTDPSKYVFNDAVKVFFMVCDLFVLKHGTCDGFVYIADATGLSLGHIGRINPLSLKKFIYFIQDAAPIRLKGIHIINTPPAFELLMNMIKPFMKKELLNLITLHSALTSLEQYVPVAALPNDAGGKAGNAKDIAEAEYKNLEDHREWFIQNDPLYLVNESLRVGKSKTASDLFGVEGSFKKLDID